MRKYKLDFSSLLSGVDKNTVGLKDMVKLIDGLSLNQVAGDYKELPFSSKATTYLYSGGVTSVIFQYLPEILQMHLRMQGLWIRLLQRIFLVVTTIKHC